MFQHKEVRVSVIPTLIRSFLFPIWFLAKGRLTLILFTLILVVPAWYSALVASKFLPYFFSVIDKHSKVDPKIFDQLLPLAIWCLALPIFILAITLPIRAIWHQQKLSLKTLFDEIGWDLERAVLGTYLSLSGGIVLVAAAFFVFKIVFKTYNLHLIDEEFQQVITIFILLSCSLVFIRSALRFIALPFVAITAKMSPSEALAGASRVLHERRISFLILLTVTTLLLIGIHLAFHNFNFSLGEIQLKEALCLTAALWFQGSSIVAFLLSTTEGVTTKYVAALRRSATPIRIEASTDPKLSLAEESGRAEKIRQEKLRRETNPFTAKDMELILR